jgi:hypothetical protein
MRVASIFSFRSHACAFSGAALFLALTLTPSAQAGFLEEIFGGDDAPPQVAAPRAHAPRRSGGGDFSIRLNEGRRAGRATEGRKAVRATKAAPDADGDRRDYVAGSRPQKPHLCAVSQNAPAEGTETAYLRDETLRAGDSVVTTGDIVVFKGHSACPHTAADFVPLARANLPRGRRNVLADLERAMKSPAHPFGSVHDKQAAARVVGQVSQSQ